jgi:hypothetical protein
VLRVSIPPLVGQNFTKVLLPEGRNDVNDVCEVACAKFPHWGVTVDEVSLFIVREGRERALTARYDPSVAAAILTHANELDPDEAVVTGSWLLARVPAPRVVVASTDMLSQQLSALTAAVTASSIDSRRELTAAIAAFSTESRRELTAAIAASSTESRSQLSALTTAVTASSIDSRRELTAAIAASFTESRSQLSALTTAVTALSALRSSPKSTPRSGGASTPVTGGSGSPTTNVARETLRQSLRAALRVAYAAASPLQFSPPLNIFCGTDSRSLPPRAQQLLFAHRFLTFSQNINDFENEVISRQFWVQPSATKGLSLFVVLSANLDVIAAAHAVCGAVTRTHYGCGVQQLSELPESLNLTFDRVLEQTDSLQSPSAAIVWHATLTPKTPMLYTTFWDTYEKWTKQLCAIEAAAECPSDIFVDPSDLHVMSSSLEPYFASKLAGFAPLHSQQPAGGSPGA